VEAENSDMTWMRNVSTSCLMILKSLPTLKECDYGGLGISYIESAAKAVEEAYVLER